MTLKYKIIYDTNSKNFILYFNVFLMQDNYNVRNDKRIQQYKHLAYHFYLPLRKISYV